MMRLNTSLLAPENLHVRVWAATLLVTMVMAASLGPRSVQAAEEGLVEQQAVLEALATILQNKSESESPIEPALASLIQQIQHEIEIYPNSKGREVTRLIEEISRWPAPSEDIRALREALEKWKATLPGLTHDDVLDWLKNRPNEEPEITAADLSRRRTVLAERIKSLDQKLNGAGAGRASWELFLRWDDTRRFTRDAVIEPSLIEQIDRRWRNAPLAWSHDLVNGASAAMKDTAIALRRKSAGDTSDKNQDREYRVANLWSSAETNTDPEARRMLAQIRGEMVQLGRSPALVDRMDRAFSHANCVVRVSSEWLKRRAQTEFERPISVDDNYGGANMQGSGVLTGQLSLAFAPFVGSIRGQIRVNGVSRTRTFGGASGVSVDSSSTTVAEAFKSFTFAPDGLASEPTRGTADTDVVYNSISSGGRSRRQNIAVNEVYARRSASEQQASEDARRWMSSELDQRFEKAVAPWRLRYQNEVRNALIRKDQYFPTIRCGSTTDYVFWRCWLRDWDEFAAPNEPPHVSTEADCTIALHESFIQRACLARFTGVRVTHDFVHQHWGWLLDAFPSLSTNDGETEENDLAVTLAEGESVKVNVADGHLRVEMRFAAIEAEGNSYEHQLVKTDYEVGREGDALLLRRTGPISVTLTDADGQPRNTGSRQVAFRRLIERKMERVLQKEIRSSSISVAGGAGTKPEELVFAEAVASDGWLQFVLRSRPAEVVVSSPSAPGR